MKKANQLQGLFPELTLSAAIVYTDLIERVIARSKKVTCPRCHGAGKLEAKPKKAGKA